MTSGLSAPAGESPVVVLRAAAAQGRSGIEVRLRWSLTDGWLPDGGFNLYRSDRSAPLNAAPLGAASSGGSNAQIDIGTSHPFELGKLLGRARQLPPSVTLPPLAIVQAHPPTAQAQFDRLGTQPAARAQAGVPVARIAAPTSPLLRAGPKVPLTPPTPEVIALSSRRTLLLGAALHRAVSRVLGLSFDDSAVTAGQTYTYTLRPISNGSEGAVIASVTISVPTDAAGLKPTAPTGLRAVQTGPDTVALRWDRLSAQAEADLGVAKYDVYRMGEDGNRQKLNSAPVLVVDVASPGPLGSALNVQEPVAFFIDDAPALGKVEYQLVVTDIFDRSSEIAKVVTSVADLHAPRAVPFAAAQLQAISALARRKTYSRPMPFHIAEKSAPPQSVLVAWQASPDTDVTYRIYRVNAEQVGATPQLLSAAPVQGSAVTAAALPPGSIRDAFAEQECSRLAHAGTLSNFAPSQISVQNTGRGMPNRFLNCDLAALSPSDRAALEQKLLSSVQVLTWQDSSAAKDHYYRYFVSAVFTRNAQESTPITSNTVAYPDLTPPATPAGIAASFQVAAPGQSGNAEASSAGVVGAVAGEQPRGSRGKALSPLTLSNWSGPLLKSPPRDMGGTMVVKWQPSRGAARYEVYRANMTHITVPAIRSTGMAAAACASNQTISSGTQQPPAIGSSNGANTSPSATIAGHVVVARMPVCIAVPVLASIDWRVPPKDSDFVLLGAVSATEYDDALSRSSAQYYEYRVVPVNRWNVPGPMIEIDARAPATQPPTPPKLVVGAASPDGGAQVEFLPDGDPGEEVVRYELWRSTLLQSYFTSVAPAAADSTNSQGGTTASVFSSGHAHGGAGKAIASRTSAGRGQAASSSQTTHPRTGLAVPGAALHSGSLRKIALGPSTTRPLAGTAARFGVHLHQPVTAAASRAGASYAAAIAASLREAQKVDEIDEASLPPGSNTGVWFTDAPAGLDWRKDYAYVVKAIDKDGLESDSEPVDITPIKLKAGAPAHVTAALNEQSCAVDVSWQATDPQTAGFIVERQLVLESNVAPASPPGAGTSDGMGQSAVYRNPRQMNASAKTALNDPDYVQLSQVNSNPHYTDVSAFPDNSYIYRVRAIDQAGNISDATSTAEVVAIPDSCGATSAQPLISAGGASGSGGVPGPSGPSNSGGSTPMPAPAQASLPLSIQGGAASAVIPVNGVTTLTFRIQNPGEAPLTGLELTSALPPGLVIALPNALVDNCAGRASAPPWMGSLTLRGGSLPPNNSCTVSVRVTGTTAGQKQVSAVVTESGASQPARTAVTITVQPAASTPANPNPVPPQPKPSNPPPARPKVVPA